MLIQHILSSKGLARSSSVARLSLGLHVDWVFILGPQTYNGDSTCAPCYEYSVVSDPFNLSLFVLARDPQTFYSQYNATVIKQIVKAGFTESYNSPKVCGHVQVPAT